MDAHESPNFALTNRPGHIADRESLLATNSRIAARSATGLALDGPAGPGPVTPAGRCRALLGAGGASVQQQGCQAVRNVSTWFQYVGNRAPLPKWRRGCQRRCRLGG